MINSAVLSGDGMYRYSLTRQWNFRSSPQTVTWIGLNPSTADVQVNDPTIRKAIKFSRAWGYDKLNFINPFAYRATSPDDLLEAEDPIGLYNGHYVIEALDRSDLIIAAWGVSCPKSLCVVIGGMVGMLRGYRTHCLGLTKDGSPKHPLYIADKTLPKRYHP